MSAPAARRSVAIFDFGGVLFDWNPRHLYRKLFAGDDAAMEDFLANVCTTEWNECQDAGRTFEEATLALMPQHADKRELIEAWGRRFGEMIAGPIKGTVAILGELKARGVPLYAVTNWSAETFPPQRARFPFLEWFDGIVVSGEEGLIKPDAEIFNRLLKRYDITLSRALFIDDSPRNVTAAAELGFHALRFVDAHRLRQDLIALGLPIRAL